MSVPVIETERLRLRGWRESDAAALAKINADAEFVKYLGDGKPLNKIDSWKVLAIFTGHWVLKGFGLWLIEDKVSSEFVGRAGLIEPEGWPDIEIGWSISPKHWGKGYASEVAKAAMSWGFEVIKPNALISIIHPDNHASKRVAEKVGEAYSHTQAVKGQNCLIYKITKHDSNSTYDD